MSQLEDGLRSALADAADRFSPSTGIADRIEAAVAWRERRRRRIATGGAAALALSLSLGVAGASLMSDVGGGGEARIASPKTTPPLDVPQTTPPGGTTTTPPTGPAAPAPAPSGTACPPTTPTPTASNVVSGREAGSSSSNASAVVHQALTQLSVPMVSMASTGNNSSVSTGNATSSNTSNSSTTQTNTGGSTTTNNNSGPPPPPPPAPPPPSPVVEPDVAVQPDVVAPYPAAPNVLGSDASRSAPNTPSDC